VAASGPGGNSGAAACPAGKQIIVENLYYTGVLRENKLRQMPNS